VSPTGAFISVLLPKPIETLSKTRETLVGELHTETLSADRGDADLSITATRLPDVVDWLSTDGMVYRKARRELLYELSGTKQRWSDCRQAGHECRRLDYRTNDGRQGDARMYLRDGILVVVNATYRRDRKAGIEFLNSAR
jgi:hypothetical protein